MKHGQVMKSLKDKLNELLEVIPSGSKVVYLDYPFYLNVGDILIYKGTESFFKENNINVVLRMNANQFDVDLINEKFHDCIMVCQGGGNFGDIYKLHQDMRLKLVKNFKGKIVIMPQSIHYNDNEKEIADSKVFSEHKNLHFFVRDKNSLDIAKRFNSQVKLMPDMAHYLWGSFGGVTKNKVSSNILYFIRRDCEKNPMQEKYKLQKCSDWDDLISKYDFFLYKTISRFSSLIKIMPTSILKIFMNNIIAILWRLFTNRILTISLEFFEHSNTVVTSRLHGHIFSCLLSIKNDVIDNSYGKNSRYINAWTGQSDILSLKEE